MAIIDNLERISDTVWELPATYKDGMRVPARIIATEKLVREMDAAVYEQISNVATLPGITRYALCMPDGHSGYGFPIGGVAATVLWEVVRHVIVWYFRTLSLVNLVYGSLATTVIVLLTLEVAALILLFGAQVIAELERRADAPHARRTVHARRLRQAPGSTHDLRRPA